MVKGKVIRGEFAPPRQVHPRCPKALDAICRQAMAGKAEERYPSAEALAADLERYLADQPVSVLRETGGEAMLRWPRRHRGAALGLARHGEGADVKAVTWHAARLEPEGAGWVAQVVLDI